MRNFRDLDIWKESINLVSTVYALIQDFPADEKYCLSQQIRRSAISIPSNIAEGCRGSDKELIQFLNISIGSSFELETQLILAGNLNFIQPSDCENTINMVHVIQRKMNAFRSSIKNK
ncbi:MAG: four helix bundle protein [Saprospiraceae bacterium]|nr:four helix bundle protein [Saprospiraceae bacterium]